MGDLAKLYSKQISLSEWFEQIEHEEADALRVEDNEKRERLAKLGEIIGLPYDKPEKFDSGALVELTPEVQAYLEIRGRELCALRLIPVKEGVPKLRMRGMTKEQVVKEWLPKQHINPEDYRAEFIPHPAKQFWSSIFVVHEQGVFGELYPGGHHNLTQGLYEGVRPVQFRYDFNTLTLDPEDTEARSHVHEILAHVVASQEQQTIIKEKLGGEFANNHLQGYFETVLGDVGLWFVDYNRLLHKHYKDFSGKTVKKGVLAHPGEATGNVRIILDPSQAFNEGDILVCDMTTPAFVPLMKKAAAIITDRGGLLCHAAIIARELKKPCLVSTGDATKTLNEGMILHVNNGVLRSA